MDIIRDDLVYNKKPRYHADVVDHFSQYIRPRHVHDDNTSCVIEITGSEFISDLSEFFLTVDYKIEKKIPIRQRPRNGSQYSTQQATRVIQHFVL